MVELKEREKFILTIGVDPGTTESGFAVITDDYNIIASDKVPNDLLISHLKSWGTKIGVVAIESIQSYGMTMGKSTIETCYYIGRLIQTCIDEGIKYKLIPRPEYGKSICGSNKVNDALIRSALENRFGSYDKGKEEKKLKNGTIKQVAVPNGPLFKLAGETDKRSAFAVACYYLDTNKKEDK